jgi:O-antigen/teichoic acid export membrane protein
MGKNIEKETKVKWVSDSLKTVVGGTSFVFIGSLISSLFLFLTSVLIARFWTKTELGIFTLAFSILQIFTAVGVFGFDRCMTRNVAFEKGKKNTQKIPVIVKTSLFLTTIFSIIMAIILLLSSQFISNQIFEEKKLLQPLILLAFTIPFLNIITVLVSIFRGLNNIKPFVYFHQIMYSLVFISSIIFVIIFDFSFIYIFYGCLFTSCITFIILLFYSFKKSENIAKISEKKFDYDIAKKLLLFSLPLLTVTILQKINIWANNFLIGFLKNVVSVGIYNVAFVLSGFLTFPIGVLLVMYMPVASNLYGGKKINEINKVYIILTKWLCFVTFPLFLFIFLFPDFLIKIFYGSEYLLAGTALRLLALAAMITNFSGPNGATLVSIGKPRLVMYAIFCSAVINIVLNIILIPIYGIAGAAISTLIAIFIFTLIKNIFLYKEIKLKPFNLHLIKPTVIMIIAAAILFYFFEYYPILHSWNIILYLFVFYIIYFLFFILSKSIEIEDIQLIEFICNKIRIPSNKFTKFLKKFIS